MTVVAKVVAESAIAAVDAAPLVAADFAGVVAEPFVITVVGLTKWNCAIVRKEAVVDPKVLVVVFVVECEMKVN